MTHVYIRAGGFPGGLLQTTVDYIASVQTADGAIPWYPGHCADPWDHVEAAMGLTIGGHVERARRAYQWLRDIQLDNGSWYAAYKDGEVADGTRAETNFVAYIATGLWHYYLVTADRDFLQAMWPTVRRAIDFVVALQSEHGEIYWCLDTVLGVRQDALVTGCSSIYKSLECAVQIAGTLGIDATPWYEARARLGHALRHRPERFDRTWAPKTRYSMDWFYPALAGVLDPSASRRRLAARWNVFVEDGTGCRCVSDEPWVTVAESCELVMALIGAGAPRQAAELFSWLHDCRADDGGYWTGWSLSHKTVWPAEKPTWTAGAVLLAADALSGYTRASRLFTEVSLSETAQDAECFYYR